MNPLTWEASYAIVLRLIETYPSLNPETVGISELHQLIIALPDFADDPQSGNDRILNGILREWYEESSSSWQT